MAGSLLTSSADTLNVGVGQPYATIAEALAAAQAGDVIQLVDSEHYESGIVVDKDVTISGQSMWASTRNLPKVPIQDRYVVVV